MNRRTQIVEAKQKLETARAKAPTEQQADIDMALMLMERAINRPISWMGEYSGAAEAVCACVFNPPEYERIKEGLVRRIIYRLLE